MVSLIALWDWFMTSVFSVSVFKFIFVSVSPGTKDFTSRIEQKHLNKFIMFNTQDFYLSIQEELLSKWLRFAEEYIDISGKDREIIYHAHK